jgi:non-heme chloroperoxidase
MNYVNVGKENSGNIDIYYEDHGTGKPVVLIHGWPLSGASWEKQTPVLLNAGRRVITYDRRGFGKSSQPASGYNYDTFAEDLNKLMVHLDLHNVMLVGFSMGGGEVARYLGKYGSKRVERVVFLSSITPFLLKTVDNPGGVDQGVFDGIKKAIAADRPAFLSKFLSDFYNMDLLAGKLVSNQVVQYSWNIAAGASPGGTLDCVQAWLTDFRQDLARIDVPTLIVHGDADRILPVDATGRRMQEAVKGSRYVELKNGPHGIIWTHSVEINRELLTFSRASL